MYPAAPFKIGAGGTQYLLCIWGIFPTFLTCPAYCTIAGHNPEHGRSFLSTRQLVEQTGALTWAVTQVDGDTGWWRHCPFCISRIKSIKHQRVKFANIQTDPTDPYWYDHCNGIITLWTLLHIWLRLIQIYTVHWTQRILAYNGQIYYK